MALAGGGSGKANDVRAGGAFVELFAKDAKLRTALAKAKQLVLGMGETLKKIGTISLGLGLALAAPFVASLKHFTTFGDQLTKMSERTGISVEALSEFAYAAGQSGSSLEQFEISIKKMQKNLAAADDEGKTAVETLAKLGLSADELIDLNPEDQFMKIAEALASVPNPAHRAADAMAIFGKEGTGLIPLLKDGTKGIAALRQEARSLGLGVTKEQAQSATDLGDAFDRVWSIAKRIAFEVGLALSETLQDWLGTVKELSVGVLDFVKQNHHLVAALAAIALGLIAGGAAMIAFGFAAQAIGIAIGVFSSLLGILGGIFGFITSLPGAIAVVGTILGIALLDKFLASTQAGKGMFTTLKEGFNSFAETAITSWGAIVNAIKAGDMQAAFKVVTTALTLEWEKLVLFWTKKWKDFTRMLAVQNWFTSGPGGVGSLPGAGGPGAAQARAFAESPAAKSVFWTDFKAGFVLMASDALHAIGIMSDEERKHFKEDALRVSKEVAAAHGAGGVPGAMADVERARKEWEDAVARANRLQAKQPQLDRVKEKFDSAAKQIAKLPDKVRGAFTAPNWQQVLGVSDAVEKKQLAALERANDQRERVIAAIAGIPPLVFR